LGGRWHNNRSGVDVMYSGNPLSCAKSRKNIAILSASLSAYEIESLDVIKHCCDMT